ncbi:MAG: hypothetical protein OJF58_000463 [Enhydrobacter sp.]|jgi:hypothetical protein|nr:MAG: hypothetical protein OJF58_000463 [Enhydrobacter sp.]
MEKTVRREYAPPMTGREKRSGRWLLATAVNLGAVVVAVVAFGAWKRLDPAQGATRPTHIEGSITAGFYEQGVDDVGFIARANMHVTAREVMGARVIYDAVYTTGADHFRVVPAAGKPDRCVLLFGDSFTFGEGVSDGETSAAQIVARSRGRVAARNFGIGGWGPHQFLAGLLSGRFQRAIGCAPTDAFYLIIPAQIGRVVGQGQWDKHGPRFRLGPDGRPVRAGNFDGSGWRGWRALIGLDAVPGMEEADLAAALVVAGATELGRRYPGLRVHVLVWNTDPTFPAGIMARAEHGMTAAGLDVQSMAKVIPRFAEVWPDYVIDPGVEWHPNARAYERIADFILREVARD